MSKFVAAVSAALVAVALAAPVASAKRGVDNPPPPPPPPVVVVPPPTLPPPPVVVVPPPVPDPVPVPVPVPVPDPVPVPVPVPDPPPPPVLPATPAYTLVAHCGGFTFDSSGWPAGSKVWIQVSRPRGAQTVRVNNRVVDVSGVVHEKIGFQLDSTANSFRIQVVAPLGGPAPIVIGGSQNSCTPPFPNQLAGVTPMPADWLTSGGFTG